MIPSPAEYGCTFVLTGPSGQRAVFNDSTDADYVGVLDPSECSGLDSADVREDAAERTEDDGGIQGSNFYGRRPVVLAGLIRANTVEQRNERSAKLEMATDAMRADASLVWTPKGGVANRLLLRQNQPLRITGMYNKKFMVALVSADAYKKSNEEHSIEKAVNVVAEPENVGTAPTPPIIELTGAQTNPVVKNETTGEEMKFTGTIAAGKKLVIDVLNHTVVNDGVQAYGMWNFTTSKWFKLAANGKTKLKCTTGTMKVKWRDAWR